MHRETASTEIFGWSQNGHILVTDESKADFSSINDGNYDWT